MRLKTIPAVMSIVGVTAAVAIVPYQVSADNQMNVAMVGMMFMPQNITVSQGTTVIWTNQSNFMHTVTADNGMFDSGTINSGGSFMFTFNSPGTFAYYCRFHGGPGGVGMSGTVTVVSSGQNNPPMINPPPMIPPPMVMPPFNQNPPMMNMPPVNPIPSLSPVFTNPPPIQFFPFRQFFIRRISHRIFRCHFSIQHNFPSFQFRRY